MIWIIEDYRQLRESLSEAFVLADLGPTENFGTCEAALKSLPSRIEPEVILLDIGLPGISGLEGLRRLKEALPATEIIMFTVCDDRETVFEAIRSGASGYLLKSERLSRIVEAVQELKRGGAPMSSEIARRMLDEFAQAPRDESSEALALSQQERQVVIGLADGLTKKEIAEQMKISVHTVDSYMRRIYAKLHVNTVGGAVAKALRRGLV